MGIRINKALRILNVGLKDVVDFLNSTPELELTKEPTMNTKLSDRQYNALQNNFIKQSTEAQKSRIMFPKKENRKRKPENSEKVNLNTIEIIKVPLIKIRFVNECAIFRRRADVFVCYDKEFTPILNKYKNHDQIKDLSIDIILNLSNYSFKFVSDSIIKRLISIADQIENKEFYNQLKLSKNKETKKGERSNPKIEHRIQFSALRFRNGMASITYKKERYVYRDHNIRDYGSILGQIYSRVFIARKNSIKSSLIWVLIDTESRTFSFKDININKYINNLKESFLPERKKTEDHNEKKVVTQKPSPSSKSMTLVAGNIHFYNGYFLIFRTANGEIDNSLAPYTVNDPDSHEILNLVHNYFEQRFEQMRIVVKHNDATILEPSRSDLLQLRNL